MDKAQLIWHYFQLVAPWLVVSLLPSLITGLSQFPKAGGVVAVLQKILAALSILTHADSPGTFKVPLKGCAPPVGMLLAALLLTGCAYCADAHHAGEAKCVALAVAVDCGVPALTQGAVGLVPALYSRINGEAIDWQSIGQLEATHGIGLVACAVRDVEQAAGTGLDPATSGIPPSLRADIVAHRKAVRLNAQEYYASRRVQFAKSDGGAPTLKLPEKP